jgi:nucleoside-diphosphate-sugar epimerase
VRRALVIGAGGQIGTELTIRLAKELGAGNVVASDLNAPKISENTTILALKLDVLDQVRLKQIVLDYEINEVYHLAATLSATAEKNPGFSWHLNMQSLLNILDLAKEGLIQKVFWPSSVAVFGPGSPKTNTPQHTFMNPNTVYGISKSAGENWCNYYFEKYNVDVRSLRFPGLLGYKSDPGGGTTDYALWALKNAAHNAPYVSFLENNSGLPMMHMEDAIDGIIKLMSAKPEQVKVRTSYNISSTSFTPEELEKEIQKFKPAFKISYQSDFRQAIADSWPDSLDDSEARLDWGWNPKYNFSSMVQNILEGFKKKLLTVTE